MPGSVTRAKLEYPTVDVDIPYIFHMQNVDFYYGEFLEHNYQQT